MSYCNHYCPCHYCGDSWEDGCRVCERAACRNPGIAPGHCHIPDADDLPVCCPGVTTEERHDVQPTGLVARIRRWLQSARP